MSYYALALIPLYFLALSQLLKSFWWLVLPVFIVLSLNTLTRTDPSYGLTAKRQLIHEVISVVGEQPFSLAERGTCHAYAGWRYLFLSYARPPSSSTTDASLGWLYPGEIQNSAVYSVMIGDETEFAPPAAPLSIIQSGGYTAYISKLLD